MNAQVGTYRTAEGDKIDLNDKDTLAWIKSQWPAVTAERPVNMSEDYQFMPSYRIGQILQNNFGMELVSVSQQFSRSRDPRGQEHVMRFRYPGESEFGKVVGDSVPELIIMNSHNGRCCIRAMLGVFRFVCANGIVISEGGHEMDKVRHFGEKNNFESFKVLLEAMARRMIVSSKRIAAMQSVILTPHDQNQLAKKMIEYRKAPKWLEAKDVLEVHRDEDARDEDGNRDLWRTFNVVQENLTNKTIQNLVEDGRNSSIRPLSGARSQVLTNERLWVCLEEFIEKRRARMPEILLIDGEATEVEPEVKSRSFDEIIALETFEALEQVTSDERNALTKEQRAKLSKRKSYLKRKEAA